MRFLSAVVWLVAMTIYIIAHTIGYLIGYFCGVLFHLAQRLHPGTKRDTPCDTTSPFIPLGRN